jgi:hypothetical protein
MCKNVLTVSNPKGGVETSRATIALSRQWNPDSENAWQLLSKLNCPRRNVQARRSEHFDP